MSNIAIIPARGGSKRIPRKNIKEFLGKPIIAYSIEAALSTDLFEEVMVSTDDNEIAEISIKLGASVPFLRSAETSSDMAATAPVLIEVLDEYKKNDRSFSNVCCIYPCAPFVTSERLREAMMLLEESGADSIMPIVKFSYPPQRCLIVRNNRVEMLYKENFNSRSQDLEPLYHDVGQFYCAKVDSLIKEQRLLCKRTLPIILTDSEVQDIDNEDDWVEAEIKFRILKEVNA